ncbi:DUF2161 family putative PD-(D/E)XK-type phosphodiesterase [Cohnella sp. GCM10027633]|uniref:DUF2161 family putative PD-(D/E)XK-type phosphodiesterase n=1 Tax=unclassified Cohnella TaxID=2636738 RepID=UPI00363C194D
MAVKHETELYPPIKAFFTERGFEVKAEIRGCDLVAYHPGQDIPTIVEMKRIFTLPLLLQGIDRQKTGAAVWLAVERNRTKKGAHNQRFGDITTLCRRLQLGFLTVTFYKTKAPVLEVWCEPGAPYASERVRISNPADAVVAAEAQQAYALAAAAGGRKKGAARLLKEFSARSGDYNVGGSTKRKLVTAYRERALQCALALAAHGASAPRQVRDWTGCPDAGSLLRTNYYGWFRRLGVGRYELSPSGRAALKEYSEVVAAWTAKYAWATAAEFAAAKAEGGTDDERARE